MTRPTPTAELPPRATWPELFALAWRRGWFSLKPREPEETQGAHIIEFRDGQLPQWKPRITIDRRRVMPPRGKRKEKEEA